MYTTYREELLEICTLPYNKLPDFCVTCWNRFAYFLSDIDNFQTYQASIKILHRKLQLLLLYTWKLQMLKPNTWCFHLEP